MLNGFLNFSRVSVLSVLAALVAFAGAFYALPAFSATSDDVSARRAKLEADLQVLENEIDAQRKILEDKQRESVSLERDIAIFDAKISEATLSIKARNIAIEKLSQDISSKQTVIGKLSDKIVKEKESLAQLLRKTNEIDSSSLVEVVLSDKDLTEFFVDLDSFDSIKSSLSDSLDNVAEAKTATEEEKKALEEKKFEETELRKIQELQKKRIEENKAEKNKILKETKGKEKEYQKILSAKEKSAASIRSELFTLQGSKAIPFEKALEFANRVFEKTGVRQAFLLGIIAEESNLGQNVGTGNWRVDMNQTRDAPIFLQITSRLGLDPDKMPVSKKPWYGYGGAMGPAQFIPSTWVLYESKIASLTGHNPPNPWEPEDAFMAAGLLLKDNGAAKRTYGTERFAALCYLAGCKNAKKSSYAFYGNDVMELAEKYQRQIDILQGS